MAGPTLDLIRGLGRREATPRQARATLQLNFITALLRPRPLYGHLDIYSSMHARCLCLHARTAGTALLFVLIGRLFNIAGPDRANDALPRGPLSCCSVCARHVR